jgi:hypothetical protein
LQDKIKVTKKGATMYAELIDNGQLKFDWQRTTNRQHTFGVMRGDVLTFKFSFSIGVWW